jgi:hypothetical protein
MGEREVVDLTAGELAGLRAAAGAISRVKMWITVPIVIIDVIASLYGASKGLDGDRVSALLWVNAVFLGFAVWFQFFIGAHRKDLRLRKKEILTGPVDQKLEVNERHEIRVCGEWTHIDVTTYTRLDVGDNVRIERLLGSGGCLSCHKVEPPPFR